MWYVINKQNGQKLIKFRKKIIIPLFNYMIKYKRENRTDSFSEFLKEISEINKKLLNFFDKNKYTFESIKRKEQVIQDTINEVNVLIYICKRKTNKISFVDCVDKLLSNYDKFELESQIYVFFRQNIELKKRKSFINESPLPQEWHTIFKDFFYEKFFSMKQIWTKIGVDEYSRDIFHDNFKSDNQIYVCPYCDSSEISDNGNLEIEHFWPKSKYPFLSMSPLNLYSSCKSCNRTTGKGTTIFNPMIMPFHKQIGDDVRFIPNVSKKNIHITGKTQAIDNYIKLMNLDLDNDIKCKNEYIIKKYNESLNKEV